MENQLVSIQIDIAGRPFPLKVNVGEENEVQEIVAGLNTRLNDFKSLFPRQDKVDYLSMALLTYATDLHKSSAGMPPSPPPMEQAAAEVIATVTETEPIISEQLTERLTHLEALLDKLLEA